VLVLTHLRRQDSQDRLPDLHPPGCNFDFYLDFYPDLAFIFLMSSATCSYRTLPSICRMEDPGVESIFCFWVLHCSPLTCATFILVTCVYIRLVLRHAQRSTIPSPCPFVDFGFSDRASIAFSQISLDLVWGLRRCSAESERNKTLCARIFIT